MTEATDPPRLPGHEIVGPVGFGAHGAVWAARDHAGRDVVVSVLALPGGDAGTAQLRRLAALRHGTHPHLARMRQVVGLDAGRCAVVTDRVAGPTLATVVAARGALEAGELAGLLSGVGSALGHLHERGVVHGDVSPANVVITGAGVPVLVDLAGDGAHDLGTPGFVPPERARGGVAGAPGDVWALARLIEWAAGGSSTPHLLQLLEPALAPVPGRRPAARDLASRAPGIAAAGPVALPPAAALAQARMRDDVAPTRRRPATRRARQGERTTRGGTAPLARRGASTARRPAEPLGELGGRATTGSGPVRARHVRGDRLPTPWLGGAVTLGVAAILAGLITWSAPGERAGVVGHRPAGGSDAIRYEEVVDDLLARRDGALVARDAAALAATTVPGGPAAREDVVLLDRLTASATELAELRTEVRTLESVTTLEDGVAVDVVLAQDAHERVVAGQRLAVPAQAPDCARVVVVPGAGDSWRILRTEPCP